MNLRVIWFVLLVLAINLIPVITIASSDSNSIPALVRDFHPDANEYFLPANEFSQSFSLLHDPVTFEHRDMLNPRLNITYAGYGLMLLLFRDAWIAYTLTTILLTALTCWLFVRYFRTRISFLAGILFGGLFYIAPTFISGNTTLLLRRLAALIIPGIDIGKRLLEPTLMTPTRTGFYIIFFAFLFLFIRFIDEPSKRKKLVLPLALLFASSFFVHFYLVAMIVLLVVGVVLVRKDCWKECAIIMASGIPSALVFLGHAFLFSQQAAATDIFLRFAVIKIPLLAIPGLFAFILAVLMMIAVQNSRLSKGTKLSLWLIFAAGLVLDNLQLLGIPNPQPGQNFFTALHVAFPFAGLAVVFDIFPRFIRQDKIKLKNIAVAVTLSVLLLLSFQKVSVYSEGVESLHIDSDTRDLIQYLRKTPTDSVVLSDPTTTFFALTYSHNNAYIPPGFVSLADNREQLKRFVEGNLLLGADEAKISNMLKNPETRNLLFHLGLALDEESEMGGFSFWGSMYLMKAEIRGPMDAAAEIGTTVENWSGPTYRLDYIIIDKSADAMLSVPSTVVYRNERYDVLVRV